MTYACDKGCLLCRISIPPIALSPRPHSEQIQFVSLHVFDILSRFLRYVPVVYVDYPGAMSLTQIYGTFNRAMLRLIPSLRSSAQQLTDAMVEFYTMSQVLLNFYWTFKYYS
jgi:hypothetical protein